MEDAHRRFHELGVSHLGLERDGLLIGICSRNRVAELLGDRYGYAFFARAPAQRGQIDRPLVYTPDTPVRQVLAEALARKGGAFHEDVALIGADRRLLGLIPAESLAHLQNQLVEEQIHELRELARSIQQREKQLMLETLVGGIAHELNNKLTPVQGFADLLQSTGDETARASYAQCISRATAEASDIIRQLLHLSRPETGQRQAADLRDLLRDSLVMLKFRLRDKRVEAVPFQPPEPVPVLGDPSQIKQVIMNLVLNAIDATEGMPSPRIEIVLGKDPGDQARVEVRDNGTGIAPAIIDRIFDPFFTTKTPDKGTGLGLSVCSSIVRRHGGRLTVSSVPGAGACFTFSLPLHSGPAPVEPAGPAPAKRPDCSFRPPHPARRTRVLIVEDEEPVRHLLKEMIRRQFGATIDMAPNGLGALELVQRNRYDLIISDGRMPLMDGPELYTRLRRCSPALCGRFVFVTGFPGEFALEQRLQSWSVPIVKKPFSVDAITTVCAPLLNTGADSN